MVKDKTSAYMVAMLVWEHTFMNHKALGVWVYLQGEGDVPNR